MNQREIIEELKKGAYIAVHSSCSKDLVYLNCSRKIRFPAKRWQVRLNYRQFDALYRKGIIDANENETVVGKDEISQFFYYVSDRKGGKEC